MLLYLVWSRTDVVGNLVAWQTDAVDNPVTFLLNWGSLGVVLILLLTGFLYPKTHVVSQDKRIESLEADLKQERATNVDLRDELMNRIVPLLAGLAVEVPQVVKPSQTIHDDAAKLREAAVTLDQILSKLKKP